MGNTTILPNFIIRPHYIKPYDFELYDYVSWHKWMTDNWQISIYFSAAYISLIYFGQIWMSKRPAFSLRFPLLLWNIFLSFGSLFIFWRMKPEVVETTKEYGVYGSLCKRNGHTVISSFWALIFTLSKILEFGDTAFIVLRKQKLIFLHYYHHITVCIYGFYTFQGFDPTGRCFGPINAFIHFLMYGYYGFRAMGFKVHKVIAKTITCLQIFQMLIGLWISFVTLFGKWFWEDCDRPWSNILLSLAMYSSYAILFVRFFISSYMKKNDIKME